MIKKLYLPLINCKKDLSIRSTERRGRFSVSFLSNETGKPSRVLYYVISICSLLVLPSYFHPNALNRIGLQGFLIDCSDLIFRYIGLA